MVQKIIREQQARVRWFIEQRREVLEQVAAVLTAEEVISGDTLRAMLAEAPELAPMPEPDQAA